MFDMYSAVSTYRVVKGFRREFSSYSRHDRIKEMVVVVEHVLFETADLFLVS